MRWIGRLNEKQGLDTRGTFAADDTNTIGNPRKKLRTRVYPPASFAATPLFFNSPRIACRWSP
jgi:hypothetical protein